MAMWSQPGAPELSSADVGLTPAIVRALVNPLVDQGWCSRRDTKRLELASVLALSSQLLDNSSVEVMTAFGCRSSLGLMRREQVVVMARCAASTGAVSARPRGNVHGRAGRQRDIRAVTARRARGGRHRGVVALSAVAGLPVVLDVPSAGRLLGIGRTRAYRLAASGGFPCPVLRVGGTWRVPTVGVLAVLGLSVPGLDRPAAVSSAGSPAVGRVAG